MGTAPKGWDSKQSAENLPPHEDFLSILTRSLTPPQAEGNALAISVQSWNPNVLTSPGLRRRLPVSFGTAPLNRHLNPPAASCRELQWDLWYSSQMPQRETCMVCPPLKGLMGENAYHISLRYLLDRFKKEMTDI